MTLPNLDPLAGSNWERTLWPLLIFCFVPAAAVLFWFFLANSMP